MVSGVTTNTRYNAEGNPLVSTQKQMISALSSTLASKSISADVRGNVSMNWAEYTAPAKVTSFSSVPGSNITAELVTVDGLTTTTTTPAGATSITRHNTDGSTQSISGTAQRELHYSYTRNGNNLATTVTLANGSILSQSISNGNGQTIVTATPNTLGGFIYTRSEYNAKGRLTKQYQDTGSNTATTAPTLYEYDSFGNMVKQTLALSATPTKDNSPVVEMSYSVESTDEGVRRHDQHPLQCGG